MRNLLFLKYQTILIVVYFFSIGKMVSTQANEAADHLSDEEVQGAGGSNQESQPREGTLEEFNSISKIIDTPNLSNSSELIKESISNLSEEEIVAEKKVIDDEVVKNQLKFVNFGIDIPKYTKPNLGNLFGKDPLKLAKKSLYQDILYLQFISKTAESIKTVIDSNAAKNAEKLEGMYKIGDHTSVESQKDARTLIADGLKAQLFLGKKAVKETVTETINKINPVYRMKKKVANMKINTLQRQFKNGKISKAAVTLYCSFGWTDKMPLMNQAKMIHMFLKHGMQTPAKLHPLARNATMQLKKQLDKKYISEEQYTQALSIHKKVYTKLVGGNTDATVIAHMDSSAL